MLVCSGLCSIPVRMYIMRRITPTSRARPNTRTVTTRVGAIPRCFVFIGATVLNSHRRYTRLPSGNVEKTAGDVIVHR